MATRYMTIIAKSSKGRFFIISTINSGLGVKELIIIYLQDKAI